MYVVLRRVKILKDLILNENIDETNGIIQVCNYSAEKKDETYNWENSYQR